MPVFTVSGARPRQELAMAIVEGEGAAEDLIGDKILPPFPINRRTAHIVKATLADSGGLRTIAADKYIHAPGTRFERVVAKFGDDTLTVTLRGLEIVVPNETELDYDGYLDIENFFMARFGNETAPLTREALVSAAIFNTASFGSATNSSVAYTAINRDKVDGTGMNPIQDIIAGIRRVLARAEHPDTVAMSGPVWERVRTAYETLKFIRGIFRPIAEITPEKFLGALAEYGIKQVLVGDCYQNTAEDGAARTLTPIWSNTYIWVGKAGIKADASEGLGVPTLGGAGASLYWEGYVSGGVPSTGYDALDFPGGNYVESYPDFETDSEVVRVKMGTQPYIGNTRAGDLIATGYS